MQAALFDTDEPGAEDAPPARAVKANKPPPSPPRPGMAEPHVNGATLPERLAARATLREDLAGYADGTVNADELYRVLRGSLYVLTAGELTRVGESLLRILNGDGD